jgi:hypothetical protein
MNASLREYPRHRFGPVPRRARVRVRRTYGVGKGRDADLLGPRLRTDLRGGKRPCQAATRESRGARLEDDPRMQRLGVLSTLVEGDRADRTFGRRQLH